MDANKKVYQEWVLLSAEEQAAVMDRLDSSAHGDIRTEIARAKRTAQLPKAQALHAHGVTDAQQWARSFTALHVSGETEDWFAYALSTGLTSGREQENDAWRTIQKGWQTERTNWYAERNALREKIAELTRTILNMEPSLLVALTKNQREQYDEDAGFHSHMNYLADVIPHMVDGLAEADWQVHKSTTESMEREANKRFVAPGQTLREAAGLDDGTAAREATMDSRPNPDRAAAMHVVPESDMKYRTEVGGDV